MSEHTFQPVDGEVHGDEAQVGQDGEGGLDTEAAVIADLAFGAAQPDEVDPEKVYTVVTPRGSSRSVLDLEEFLPAPKRVTGDYKLGTLEAFVAYTGGHKDAEHTTLWVDPKSFKVTAVLNDHAPGVPAWGDHVAVLQLEHTLEWLHWLGKDGQMLKQEVFAEHIEDGLLEIVEPASADLLEIAQTMKGATNASWTSSKRLTNGEVQFVYSEDATATAGKGRTLDIPEKFTLAIAPFYGEEPRRMVARLRYRPPKEGALQLGYKLERPHDVLIETIEKIARDLKIVHGFENVFVGAPRA